MYDDLMYNDIPVTLILDKIKKELSIGESFLITIKEDAPCYEEWTESCDGCFILYLGDDEYRLSAEDDCLNIVATFADFKDFINIFDIIESIDHISGEEYYRYDPYEEED